MAEGEEEDVSFLRTVSQRKTKFIYLYILFYLNKWVNIYFKIGKKQKKSCTNYYFRKTWYAYHVPIPENGYVFLLRVLEIDIVFWRAFPIG